MMVAKKIKNPVLYTTRVSPAMKAALAYTSAMALTFVMVCLTTRFYRIDLSIPMIYYSDAGFYLMLIKGLVTNDWLPFMVPHTSHVGAPFDSSLHDFPGAGDANLMFLIQKIIALFTPEFGRVFNYYTLITYFLTVLTSLYALRHYRISYKIAIVFSMLFAFLPYHFMRMLGHLNIALYILIPFHVLIVTWIWSRKPIFFKRENGKYILDFKSYKARFSLVILLISGMTAIYYNYFFCFFILVAGVSAALYRKSRQHLATALMVIAITGVSVGINLAPYVLYRIQHGKNQASVIRNHTEAELYGLKISQLLLPLRDHRSDFLGNITDKYYGGGDAIETAWGSLGIIGSLGFLFLLFYPLSPRRNTRSLYYKLGLLALTGVLFATVGGFSAMVALLISPTFRAYTRIAIFIAYFSFLFLAAALNKYQKYIPRWLFNAGLAAIFLVAIWDQTSPAFKYTYFYDDLKAEFISDQTFVKDIEKAAPKNSLIFQLPFLAFPEGGEINKMSDYDPFKGYFHSSTLNWSYGSIKGRLPSRWYEYTADLPLDQMLHNLSIAGFSGIYIDRNGYKDKAAGLEKKLAELLQKQPLISPNKRLSYFDMTAYRDEVLKTIDAAALKNLKQLVLYPVEDRWSGEQWPPERNEKESWRWCGNTASLKLINHAHMARKQWLTMEFQPVRPEPYEIAIEGKDFNDVISVENSTKKFERIIEIPAKGDVTINFSSHAEPINTSKESRNLIFAIYNLQWRDVTDVLAASMPDSDKDTSSPETAEAKAPDTAGPIGAIAESWEGGCYPAENNGPEIWHWCGHDGKVILVNPSGTEQKKQLAMEFKPDHPEPFEIAIRGKDFRQVIKVSGKSELFEQTINIPAKGKVSIDFHCNAEPLKAPNETRTLVFAVYNFKLWDSSDATAHAAVRKEPLTETWEGAFFPMEKNDKESWRWCGKTGKVTLVNPSNTARKQQITMEFRPNRPDPYEVVISGKGFRQAIKINKQVEKFERTIALPAKGKAVIDFRCHSEPLKAPNEARPLVFAVYNFEVKDANEGG